jgi:nitrous oxide reductase accessory protein NosL
MMRKTLLASLMMTTLLAAACSRSAKPPQAQPKPPTLDETSWTSMTELYMEHPPLVAGQTVRFAVHPDEAR